MLKTTSTAPPLCTTYTISEISGTTAAAAVVPNPALGACTWSGNPYIGTILEPKSELQNGYGRCAQTDVTYAPNGPWPRTILPTEDGSTYTGVKGSVNCDGTILNSAECSSVTISNANPLTITNTGNNTGGPLAEGEYSITAIGSCTNVRFNCIWHAQDVGCSIQVNGGTIYSGTANSSNNAINPVPTVGATLKVTGTVTNIWCAGW